ncbi:MAG TPA: EamA/RhaT family transporter, partial [Candidatus Propionivibrio aalborgensis]|nr:EamA/RhaT family transporter [Candidatus Propionivibrio aalborgensis]
MPSLKALAPILFVFLWSTGFIGAKFGLPYADPLTFLLARYILVLCLMT